MSQTKLDLTPKKKIVIETDLERKNQVQNQVENLTSVIPQIIIPI